jgi:hypothetical protein
LAIENLANPRRDIKIVVHFDVVDGCNFFVLVGGPGSSRIGWIRDPISSFLHRQDHRHRDGQDDSLRKILIPFTQEAPEIEGRKLEEGFKNKYLLLVLFCQLILKINTTLSSPILSIPIIRIHSVHF